MRGLEEALRKRSSRLKKIRVAFDGGWVERLREMLYRSPMEKRWFVGVGNAERIARNEAARAPKRAPILPERVAWTCISRGDP